MVFSSTTRELLQAAGWFPERHIDITAFVQALEANHYRVHEAVKVFLAAYGRLEIRFLYDDKAGMDEVLFDPCFAMDLINLRRVQAYSERAKKLLCPIGSYSWLHDTILMAEDGHVYGGSSIYLDFIGHSGEEVIENILKGRERWFEQLP